MKGIIEIPKEATRQPGAPAPRKVLDDVIATMDTILCIVFGEGPDADEVSAIAERFARTSSDCEDVQVVRIRDPQILTDGEAAWRPAGDKIVTLLTSDRKVSGRLTAPEARAVGGFLIALQHAVAGEAE